MSNIKGTNTKPEVILRKILWKKGFRYSLNHKLPGKPDLVFVSALVAIFVDGCFWHGCPLHCVKPKTNSRFWRKKLQKNTVRDEVVNKQLSEAGWTVFRCWEHEIEENIEQVIQKISELIKNQ